MNRLNKLLLTELRIIQRDSTLKSNQGNLELALLDNENLKALGYTLKFDDIVKLAKDYNANENMTPLYKRIQTLEPKIEVSPMYPNFPKQVLEMDELEFRTNQVIHYLTTYGLESLLDIEITKGYLPATLEIDERFADKQVAKLKTLDYLSESEIDTKVIKDLIGRKERLGEKELEIAKAVIYRTDQTVEEIPFKENIGTLFGEPLLKGNLEERQEALRILANIVKHPGDVLDLVEQLVVLNKYKHFKTSLKRGLVDLIEKFPNDVIEENLASNRWSNRFRGKKGKARCINRNIALIDYLSYNRFSKNDDAKNIVVDLKNGNLISWNQKLEAAYANKDYDTVLKMLAQRPGVYFRQINRLIKLGVNRAPITVDMRELAGTLKTQSIVSALNNFTGSEETDQVFFDTLYANLNFKNIESLRNKKVYIDEQDVMFSKSKLEITDKFAEGGYISNGMAIKIPEDAKYLRFFTYWNDKRRIDIDLHGASMTRDGIRSHVGWHSRHKDGVLVHSGDITHSDATEYIDMDIYGALKEDINRVQFNINSYTCVPFANIDTVFTGLMALSEMGQQVDLFDPKNVLFRHDLECKHMSIDYGMVDLENKVIYVGGKPSDYHNDTNVFDIPNHKLTIETYLNMLLLSQGATLTNNPEEADVVLGLAKSDRDNYVSLVDVNFFM